MLFNSLDFFLFLTVFLIFWPFLRRKNCSRYLFLIVASFVFYGWWDWRFLGLILLVGATDFLASLGMSRFWSHKKFFLIMAVTVNVGILAAFKYSSFIIDNLNGSLSYFDVDMRIEAPRWVLPIGISFYTFQSMSYTIDIFRGNLKPTRNILHFFAFLSLFPQLVAGPIVRARELLPQIKKNTASSEKQRWEGLILIVHGFFKKVVIADNLAVAVNVAFASRDVNISFLYWWVIMVMFAFQIYCDFSGYSDIARGLGKWMGYEFPVNFAHPYISSTFQEFWTRWHISLSSWFRDYVYIPLGGSRKGKGRSFLYLWITMLISGMWHGAAWTFIFWGMVHSIYLSLERIVSWPTRLHRMWGGRHLATCLTFMFVILAWVFFRANSLQQATKIFSSMLWIREGGTAVLGSIYPKYYAFLLIAFLRELYFYLGLDKKWINPGVAHATQLLTTSFMILACVFLRGPGDAFIYFQF